MRNRIALGTAQFGSRYGIANASGQPGTSTVRAILHLARAEGIASLDTAIAYGSSEEVLGAVGVRDFELISKLPAIPDQRGLDVGEWVNDQVCRSIGRLKVGQLDALLLHRPSQLLGDNGAHLYAALLEQVSRGRVRRIGVSVYDPSELDPLISRFDLDVVQAPLNILDARLSSEDWVARLQTCGIALHARSVFLQGLLLMPQHQRPAYFMRWRSLFKDWDEWLAAHELSALEACLRYALHAPGVEQVVLGVDNTAQLAEIMGLTDKGPLPLGYQALQTQDAALLNPSVWALG